MLLTLMFAVFILIAATVFAFAWFFDQQRDTGRVMHERLNAVAQASARAPSEELALLRDELISEIPALNKLLAKSARVSALQRYLSQAAMEVRAGKFLLISAACAVVLGAIAYFWSNLLFAAAMGAMFGGAIPFLYAGFRRSQRFHRFEELFPEAIELLARAV